MKKILLALIISICFIPFMKVKAFGALMCGYEGQVLTDGTKGHLYMFIDGSGLMIQMDTMYTMDEIDVIKNAITGIFHGDLDEVIGNNVKTYTYHFSKSLKTLTRYNQQHIGIGIYDLNQGLNLSALTDRKNWFKLAQSPDVSTDIFWTYEGYQVLLKEKGRCPDVITFGCDDCVMYGDYDSQFEFYIGDSPQSDSTENGSIHFTNYYLMDYQFFTTELAEFVNSHATTCLTDEKELDKVISLFDMTYPYIYEHATDTELAKIRRYYVGNGFDTAAHDYIKNYQPGGSCYNDHSDLREKYGELVEAAFDFLSHIEDTSDIVVASSCEDIIGSGTFASYLNKIFHFIQYIGPLVVIVVSTIEYIKVVSMSDADLLKKTNKKTVTRLIFAMLLFLIPVLVKVLLNLFGFYGDCLDSFL